MCRNFARVSAAYMLSPWTQYPTIPLGSLAWRMGDGEEYRMSFGDSFARRAPDAKRRYAQKNPEPPG